MLEQELRSNYAAYKAAYKKERIGEVMSHLKSKFAEEDALMDKYLNHPIKANWYNLANGVYSFNEGKGFPHISKILDRGKEILYKIAGIH